jgi:nicotinate-nucleotide adenylyltransferase
VVTPHNPLKKKKTLLDDYQRLHMVSLAVEGMDDRMIASNFEFSLPQPSYTVHTLARLREKYPTNEFVLTMGMDNLKNFTRWKNYQSILDEHDIIVYPRISEGEVAPEFKNHPRVQVVQAPIIEISSTMIRQGISEGRDLRFFLPPAVHTYIDEMNFYK